jgi:hypothetical protein
VPVSSHGYPRAGLHGRIVYAIGRRIVSGAIRPGEQLPTPARVRAGRGVLREAIKVLAAKGLVVIGVHVPSEFDPLIDTAKKLDGKLTELSDALLIPSEAVIPGVNEKNVFVMHDGKAERRTVETGTRTASTVHVLAGLKAGDVVIVSGLQQMRAGQSVAPLDPSVLDISALEASPALSAQSPHAAPAAKL